MRLIHFLTISVLLGSSAAHAKKPIYADSYPHEGDPAPTADPAAIPSVTSNCACADGRQLSIGDFMRSTEADQSVDPDKEWSGYQNWNQVRSVFGRIQALQSAGPVCPGALAMDWVSKNGRKLELSLRPVSNVGDLCALARIESETAPVKGQKSNARLSDLAESGELDDALTGTTVRDGVPVSPYPRALGPYTPGQGVYSIQGGHGIGRGHMGIVLGASKNGQLAEVGFYCKRISGMELASGLVVGAFVASDAHKKCKKEVPWTQLAPTADAPPIHGAP